MTSIRTLIRVASMTGLVASVMVASAATAPVVTRPAAFDVAQRIVSQKDAVKPGETAAALLRSAQAACPENESLAQVDPSKLRYALLGGNWLSRRVSEKSILADSAQWNATTFLSNVEKGTGMIDNLNLYTHGLQCGIGASEVAWLFGQVNALGAEHLRQGKSRMALYAIPELGAFKAPPKSKGEATKSPRYWSYFPDYLKAKPNTDTRFLYAADNLERSIASLQGDGNLFDEEVADWFCWTKGRPLKGLERASRGIANGVTEYAGDYACEDSSRADSARDRAVAKIAQEYERHGAKLVAAMKGRFEFNASLRFGDLNREQAYALIRWAMQSGIAMGNAACGKGMYVIPKSVELWLVRDDPSRDALITIETNCGRQGR